VRILRHLKQDGVRKIASFVPWGQFEGDITHQLKKFLQLAAAEGVEVSLIVSHEPALCASAGGAPKDLLQAPSAKVQATKEGRAPEVATLTTVAGPAKVLTLRARATQARYEQYLARLESSLADWIKLDPKLRRFVRLISTSGAQKYLRPKTLPGAGSRVFQGICADFSGEAEVLFRQELDRKRAHPDFFSLGEKQFRMEWETRCIERQRARAQNTLQRNSRDASLRLPLEQIELYRPEIDPYVSDLVQAQWSEPRITPSRKFAELLWEVGLRSSSFEGEEISNWIFWNTGGAFSRLTLQERCFLLVLSMLQVTESGGAVLVKPEEWSRLPQGFRDRWTALHSLGSMRPLRREVVRWVPCIWSDGDRRMENFEATRCSSLTRILKDPEVRVIVVDPGIFLDEEQVKKLLSWVRVSEHRSLVLPEAWVELAKHVPGIYCGDEEAPTWGSVWSEVMGRSKLRDRSRLVQSDRDPEAIEVARWCESGPEGNENVLLEFLINFSGVSKGVTVAYRDPVAIENGEFDRLSASGAGLSAYSDRFQLEVPPWGVLPLRVRGLGEEARERRLALETEALTQMQPEEMAKVQLEGFDRGGHEA
jgi:hypothetical protein